MGNCDIHVGSIFLSSRAGNWSQLNIAKERNYNNKHLKRSISILNKCVALTSQSSLWSPGLCFQHKITDWSWADFYSLFDALYAQYIDLSLQVEFLSSGSWT